MTQSQIGKKSLFLISHGGFQIYKSYSTVIAVFVPGKNLLLQNADKYSVTTSKHSTIVGRRHPGAGREYLSEQEIGKFLLENVGQMV